MAHVPVPDDQPGIVGLLTAFPQTGRILGELAQTLLRGPSPLSAAERELIAAHVSARNECRFCTGSHAAAARHLWGDESRVVDQVVQGSGEAAVDDRLRSLLSIAEKVQHDPHEVGPQDIARARRAGADDRAIHDTVLIAAAFCIFNRYVDGLGTAEPESEEAYAGMGRRLAEQGYLRDRAS